MSPRSETQRKSEAAALVAAWRRAGSELDSMRVERLRALTEQQAAQEFSRISSNTHFVVLRASSGLVEQQVLFDRLREKKK